MSEKQIQAINEILDLIRKETLLHQPDFNKNFKLSIDASNIGVYAILLQEQELVGIYSNKISPADIKYSIVEKEALAVKNCLQHFKARVFLSKMIVFTDSLDQTFIVNSNLQINKR